MAKEYKIWIHVEEHDTETDEDVDLMNNHTMEPIFAGVLYTEAQLKSMEEALDHFFPPRYED